MSENRTKKTGEENLRLVDTVLPIPATVTIDGSLVWPKIWGVIFSIYWTYVIIKWGVRPNYAMQLALFIVLTFGIYKSSRVCSVLLAIQVALSLAEGVIHSGIKTSQIYDLVALYMIIQGTVAMFRVHARNAASSIQPPLAVNNNRNVGDLIGWFIIWSWVFMLVASLITAVFINHVYHPNDLRAAFERFRDPLIFISLLLSASLTMTGKLPGTRKI